MLTELNFDDFDIRNEWIGNWKDLLHKEKRQKFDHTEKCDIRGLASNPLPAITMIWCLP